MKALMDLHCHTINSGHAYSTLEEMIAGAKRKDIKVLGISDHAPSMPGGAHKYFFQNTIVWPREIDGLILLRGIEANIIDYDGNIDIDEDTLKKLDYAIASFHPPCIDPGCIDKNTNAIINVIKNPYVKIIGHPDDSRYPLDYELVVKAAKEHNVALEVNNSSLNPGSFRVGANENVKNFLNLCKENKTKVIFGSDSHISYDVASFHNSLSIAEQVGFPMELIVNYNKDLINDLIGKTIL
ncbi:PHP domain-containing hydrolase [Gottschalkia acidurici 9a]|uniref:PHP domain-containing hydrolase n=1 Tax=Gottschalkia acidurici (strain ATCC 7906 / DSM 604 / BCRC 14475 / CIP 104303 / KCTC 5404 / NCIMB 10678 / 9a) TaxID=1128398 RepID=K0B3H3_GOTA9|nr:phosphatase [Gottschalkia acidurici]AFS79722.1 PHP domain-containing hydrolase [Gottschalkia acidurici 9a]